MKFLPVPGYENLYTVSESGVVESFGMVRCKGGALKSKASKVLHQEMGKDRKKLPSYWRVSLWKDGKKWKTCVHQLVALAFLGPIPEGLVVNHKDGDKLNNHISNLEYVTRSENQLHAYATGLQKIQHGERGRRSKLTEVQVLRILQRKDKVKDLAIEMNVSESIIYLIRSGRRWSHLSFVPS